MGSSILVSDNHRAEEFRALLVRHYALTPPLTFFPLSNGVNNQVIGVRDGQHAYAFKEITAPHLLASLQKEQQLVQWLADQRLSFAVPTALPTRQGDLLLPGSSSYYLLMPLLPGQPADWRDTVQMELVGKALAELHDALRVYPGNRAAGAATYGALDAVHPLIPQPAALTPTQLHLPATEENEMALAWWRGEVAALQNFIDEHYRALPRQWIHGDFLAGNTLYLPGPQGGRITAILDFEFAGVDVRAMDLASALYFCMRIWENPPPPVDALTNAAAVCRGYAKGQRLHTDEIAAIPWLTRLRNVVSTIWWFGRQLSTGTPPTVTERIDPMQQWVAWLESTAGQQFVTILHQECGPTNR